MGNVLKFDRAPEAKIAFYFSAKSDHTLEHAPLREALRAAANVLDEVGYIPVVGKAVPGGELELLNTPDADIARNLMSQGQRDMLVKDGLMNPDGTMHSLIERYLREIMIEGHVQATVTTMQSPPYPGKRALDRLFDCLEAGQTGPQNFRGPLITVGLLRPDGTLPAKFRAPLIKLKNGTADTTSFKPAAKAGGMVLRGELAVPYQPPGGMTVHQD